MMRQPHHPMLDRYRYRASLLGGGIICALLVQIFGGKFS